MTSTADARRSRRKIASLHVSARQFTLLLGLLVGLILSGGFIAIPRASAATAPPCFASGCYGKDPQASGCSSQQTVTLAAYTQDYAYVELRYSGWCGAAWAKISVDYHAPYAYCSTEFLQIWNSDKGLYDYVQCSGPGKTDWTYMVNDWSITAWACTSKWWFTDPTPSACTRHV